MERTQWPMEAGIALLFLFAMVWAGKHVDDPRLAGPEPRPTPASFHSTTLPR